MTAPTPTRERLITEAIRLFGDKGFEATSVSQIEAAAGLSAGSGALYRHFKSKDDVLTACIDRQLDRRSAMRKMRTLFTGLSDLHSELTVIGRYLFSVIDSETELLQIAARTPPGLSEQLDNAYAALIETLRDELHGWISDWASRVAPEHTTSEHTVSDPTASEHTRSLATVCLTSLLGQRYVTNIVRQSDALASDEEYLKEWTALLVTRLQESFA